jgi:hypothetical protein
MNWRELGRNIRTRISAWMGWLGLKGRGGTIAFLAGAISLIIMVITAVGTGLAPMRLMKEYRGLAESDSIFISRYDPVVSHPTIVPLSRERSFREALISLSELDSIQPAIDLRDSTILLTIRGVTIHRSTIEVVRTDPFLEKLPQREYTRLFALPVRVLDQRATIVKEPVVVREAPRDTIEAVMNAYKPDTMIQRPAFLQLELEHNLRIILEQNDPPRFRDRQVRFWFRFGTLARTATENLTRTLCLRSPEYSPTIVVRLPANQLRAIYRALPDQAVIVVAY